MRRTSPTAHHAARFVRLLALGALSLAAAGCRTFNYTDADLDEERRLLAEREGLEGGWGVGGGFSPGVGKVNLGGISCPNAGSGVCPGKQDLECVHDLTKSGVQLPLLLPR
jgi:hypothetical protein